MTARALRTEFLRRVHEGWDECPSECEPPDSDDATAMITVMAGALVSEGADLTDDNECIRALIKCRFRGPDIFAHLDDALRHALAQTAIEANRG